MLQTQIIKLNCQSCESSLNISQDMENFACGHCGTAQIVERKGGIVQLKKVTDAIGKVQRGTDKTAAELALNRLPQELNDIKESRLIKQNQLNKKYDDRWNLQLGIVIVVAIVALAIMGAIIQRIKLILPNFELTILIFIFVVFAATIVGSSFLFKYFSDTNLFGLKTILKKGNKELAVYDNRIQYLQMKIQENYQIANS
jgi:hypothetical protein